MCTRMEKVVDIIFPKIAPNLERIVRKSIKMIKVIKFRIFLFRLAKVLLVLLLVFLWIMRDLGNTAIFTRCCTKATSWLFKGCEWIVLHTLLEVPPMATTDKSWVMTDKRVPVSISWVLILLFLYCTWICKAWKSLLINSQFPKSAQLPSALKSRWWASHVWEKTSALPKT